MNNFYYILSYKYLVTLAILIFREKSARKKDKGPKKKVPEKGVRSHDNKPQQYQNKDTEESTDDKCVIPFSIKLPKTFGLNKNHCNSGNIYISEKVTDILS